ncbi:MAG TPA: hypothetical protein VHY91_10490 [Pirellulales bacterium]|jgi:hypothetical protein|nr:hypothetical protein [Pirellulales bacterium]
MAEDRGKVTTVVWPEVFPWLNLVTALRLAFNPRALVFAALAWVAMTAGWRLCGAVFTAMLSPEQGSHLAQTIDRFAAWPWFQRPPVGGWGRPEMFQEGLLGFWSATPVVEAHLQLAAPFFRMFNPAVTLAEFSFLFICGLWALAVWSFFGGAITRLAAVALAREESLSWGYLAQYAQAKWPSYFAAPLFPLVGVAGAAIPLAVLGLLLRSDVGLVIAGALWFLVLLAGLFMAVLLVGLFFGFPLMWATISAEGTDAFDALSRAYAYTYQRPLLYALYSIAAGALGMLGWMVVVIFTSAIFDLGAWGVSWSSGERIVPETLGTVSWGAALLGDGLGTVPLEADVSSAAGMLGLRLMSFWIDLAVSVAMAFMFSYFWTANTAIYFLLRRHVDATEMDEVFIPDQEDRGLPPLDHDAAGVPGVADAPLSHGAEVGPTVP